MIGIIGEPSSPVCLPAARQAGKPLNLFSNHLTSTPVNGSRKPLKTFGFPYLSPAYFTQYGLENLLP